MENPFESEVISSIELKSGDIVFCCHFEDFNNMYLCKSSTDNVGPENFKVIIDFSKVAGNLNFIFCNKIKYLYHNINVERINLSFYFGV